MKALILLIGLVLQIKSVAMPAQILLIRHGEKPPTGNQLSAQGWQRAAALPNLFNRPEFDAYGAPVALYAMAPETPAGSVRAIQTLKYVSDDLKLPINTQFTRDQIAQLVNDIKSNKNYDGKMVVVCWEHTVLISIAQALGEMQPLVWPDTQFDRVWSLTYSADGQLQKFEDLPEKLLPTDSQE
ncbi:MAG: histidine phosphatase family protein [Pseudobdellovibrio sp.]